MKPEKTVHTDDGIFVSGVAVEAILHDHKLLNAIKAIKWAQEEGFDVCVWFFNNEKAACSVWDVSMQENELIDIHADSADEAILQAIEKVRVNDS